MQKAESAPNDKIISNCTVPAPRTSERALHNFGCFIIGSVVFDFCDKLVVHVKVEIDF